MLHTVVAHGVAAAHGGVDDLALARLDHAGRMTVATAGPVLPMGMLDELFVSLVWVRARSDAAEPHLGLGLYIVRVIAEFHHAGVRAANRDDGRGVVVTVLLPVQPA
jgi:K+-sensing histidine kinase KdpD